MARPASLQLLLGGFGIHVLSMASCSSSLVLLARFCALPISGSFWPWPWREGLVQQRALLAHHLAELCIRSFSALFCASCRCRCPATCADSPAWTAAWPEAMAWLRSPAWESCWMIFIRASDIAVLAQCLGSLARLLVHGAGIGLHRLQIALHRPHCSDSSVRRSRPGGAPEASAAISMRCSSPSVLRSPTAGRPTQLQRGLPQKLFQLA